MVEHARENNHRFFVAFQSSYTTAQKRLRATYMFTSFPTAEAFWEWVRPIGIGSPERRFFEQIR